MIYYRVPDVSPTSQSPLRESTKDYPEIWNRYPFSGFICEPLRRKIITTSKGLREVCENLKWHHHVIGINIEFLEGQCTYRQYPLLIQITTYRELWNIDPLRDGMNLRPFFDLMCHSIVKVFYNPERQLSFLWEGLGRNLPLEVFDTRVAAMYCGIDPEGYEELIKKVLHEDIKKAKNRRPRWSCQPLPQALESTRTGAKYLLHLCIAFRYWLQKLNRESYFGLDMRALVLNKEPYQNPYANAWRRIDCSISSKKKLGVLIELATARELCAEQQNKAPELILSDHLVRAIVQAEPRDMGELLNLPFTGRDLMNMQDILVAIHKGLSINPRALPDPSLSPEDSIYNDVMEKVESLKKSIKEKAEKEMISRPLIASDDDLKEIAKAHCRGISPEYLDVPVMKKGFWRREMFGETVFKDLGRPVMKDDLPDDAPQTSENETVDTQPSHEHSHDNVSEVQSFPQQQVLQLPYYESQNPHYESQNPHYKFENSYHRSQNPYHRDQSQNLYHERQSVWHQPQNVWHQSQKPHHESQNAWRQSLNPHRESQNAWRQSQNLWHQSQDPCQESQNPRQQSQNLWQRSQNLWQQSQDPYQESQKPRQQSQNLWQQSQDPYQESQDPRQQSQNLWQQSLSPYQESQNPRQQSQNLWQQSLNPHQEYQNPRQQPQNLWHESQRPPQDPRQGWQQGSQGYQPMYYDYSIWEQEPRSSLSQKFDHTHLS